MNPHVVVHVDDAETTTADFGKAEPGRDIFAGHVAPAEGKSRDNSTPSPLEQGNVEQIISVTESLITDTSMTTQDSDVQTEQSMLRDEITVETAAEVPIEMSTSTEMANEDNVKTMQGAPLEDEAEADRARQELFGEVGAGSS